MGIDIYAKWRGQSGEEKDAQITGFCTTAGNVGYLREAYHGAPYATKYLLAEAFTSKEGEAEIPAAILHERLPHTLELVEERERTIYKANDEEVRETQKSFADFVELCELKEKETGEPCTIIASY